MGMDPSAGRGQAAEMATGLNKVVSSTGAAAPAVRRPLRQGPARGMGWGSIALMWCIVLTLLAIALPRPVQLWLLRAEPVSAKGVDAGGDAVRWQALHEQVVQLQATVAALQKSVALPQSQVPPASAMTDPLRPLVDIAKLTLDASKDKYDSIKDTYDKLFSVLAAMAALLTFFGFKGLDSFVAAKRNTELAVAQADQAAQQLRQFLDHDYSRDNRAELNLAQAISLREIAALYEQSWRLNHSREDLPQAGRQVHRQYLEKANYYLKESLRSRDQLDKVLLQRALGVQCNVYRMLGDFEAALRTAKEMIERFPGEDESAYFNAACYCCLLSEQQGPERLRSEKLLIEALGHLKKAIDLYPDNKKEACDEVDLEALRVNRKQEFEGLVGA